MPATDAIAPWILEAATDALEPHLTVESWREAHPWGSTFAYQTHTDADLSRRRVLIEFPDDDPIPVCFSVEIREQQIDLRLSHVLPGLWAVYRCELE